MSSKSSSGTGLNVGGSSILMIFVLLCLTTFATLSMVSANADFKLTQKAVENSNKYYMADSAAEEIFSKVDSLLNNMPVGAVAEQYLLAQMRSLSNFELSYTPSTPTSGVVSYQVPMDEAQAISVMLTLTYPEDTVANCTISEWKTVSLVPLTYQDEETIELWTGQIIE